MQWVGTPWCDDSAVRGRGACCHRLVAAVYAEAGWLPQLDLPGGPATGARWMDSSPILEWFQGDGARWFSEVAIPDAEPGDALLVKVRRIAHHLVMFLPGQNLLHVTHERGVEIIGISPAWLRFTDRVFRPLLP